MPVKFSDLCEITLYKFYELAWSETASGRVAQRDFQVIKPGPLSDSLLFKAINDLTKSELVTGVTVRQQNIYSISKKGIEKVEKALEDEESVIVRYRKEGAKLFDENRPERPALTSDTWKQPDAKGTISAEAKTEIKDLFEALIEAVPDLALVEAEREQVKARVGAALALADAPFPMWAKVHELIEPLGVVPQVQDRAARVLRLIG